ncbi:GNAT family N-acetyltransferase [Paenibacillus whitsoniae]|nr:GNAT family N-acetyltransferase [Paenibacillus whitsoniae]
MDGRVPQAFCSKADGNQEDGVERADSMEIMPLTTKDVKSLLALYRRVTADLKRNGVKQWDFLYPNWFVVRGDLKRGTAYGLRDGKHMIGAVVVDDRQSASYGELPWTLDGARCIHRLAVDPAWQGKGLGKKLLQFAEEQARASGGGCIRLDVYSGNPGAAQLYERAGYKQVGAIRFPMRSEPYFAYEKAL